MEAIHAKPTSCPRAPPPLIAPLPLSSLTIWEQLPPLRRQRLQQLLAELLTRSVISQHVMLREEHHEHLPT